MLDGACDIERLVKRVKELEMPAVAMTDHGNIFGAVHLFNAAKDAGIKPILGCELYVCKKEDHRADAGGRQLQPPDRAGGERPGLPQPGQDLSRRLRCTASTTSRASARTFWPSTRKG